MIAQVRRFNRVVTQRVGALDDRFLARGRPLGAARVLWEVGEDGCEVRALRERLELDSGYLSRLLRSARGARGSSRVEPGERDRRVRVARLTAAGRAERAELEQRSDELAGSFLAPLGDAQRDRLVGAMAEVERLLTAAMVRIAPADPADPARAALPAGVRRRARPPLRRRVRPRRAASRPTDAELRPPAGLRARRHAARRSRSAAAR